jgi:hypothetical protein
LRGLNVRRRKYNVGKKRYKNPSLELNFAH